MKLLIINKESTQEITDGGRITVHIQYIQGNFEEYLCLYEEDECNIYVHVLSGTISILFF